jgi:hypothetical protein
MWAPETVPDASDLKGAFVPPKRVRHVTRIAAAPVSAEDEIVSVNPRLP